MSLSPDRDVIVLYADDDEDAHLLLERAFSKAGVKVSLRHVNDGSDAIQYLSGQGIYADREKYPVPDMVLLDLKMPNVSGFGVLEHLREWPEHRKCPIIVFSSSNQEADVKRAQALACTDYVVKPTDFK